MDLRKLEYFVAVAEEGNFTRAAERVHVSQSGVSAQVRQLERELGVSLLERGPRRTALTAAGAAALAPAQATLASSRAVVDAVEEVSGLVRGELTVGMVIACTIAPLFEALAAFGREHPAIAISLFEANSDQLVDAVRGGEADAALLAVAEAPPPDLEALPILSDRLVAVVPPDHPLARRRRLGLADVAAHPLVCLPPGTGIRTVLDRACAAASIEPAVALEASAPTAVADLASRGLGVGVLSEATVAPDAERTVQRITDVRMPTVLALVWKRTKSPALAAFLDHCRLAFGSTAE